MCIEIWLAGIKPGHGEYQPVQLARELATYIPAVPFHLKTWFTKKDQGSHDYVFLHIPDDLQAAHYTIRSLQEVHLKDYRWGLRADFSKGQQQQFITWGCNPDQVPPVDTLWVDPKHRPPFWTTRLPQTYLKDRDESIAVYKPPDSHQDCIYQYLQTGPPIEDTVYRPGLFTDDFMSQDNKDFPEEEEEEHDHSYQEGQSPEDIHYAPDHQQESHRGPYQGGQCNQFF